MPLQHTVTFVILTVDNSHEYLTIKPDFPDIHDCYPQTEKSAHCYKHLKEKQAFYAWITEKSDTTQKKTVLKRKFIFYVLYKSHRKRRIFDFFDWMLCNDFQTLHQHLVLFRIDLQCFISGTRPPEMIL